MGWILAAEIPNTVILVGHAYLLDGRQLKDVRPFRFG